MRCITRLFVFVVACLLSIAATGKPAWSPSADSLDQLRHSADVRWQRYFPGGALKTGTTSRDLIALALDGVASSYDANHIAQTLEALRGLQDTDANSRTYGNIFWYAGDRQIVDRNGIEFVTRHAGLLWLLYADRLTPAQRKPLQALLELARTGITNHKVSISYTNIFLMKAWNLVALGEGLQDKALAAQGQGMLRDWLDYTARNGITEYLSPTYYGVDLDNLALLRNLSSDATTQALAQAGLDNVWSDIALHWYAPAERLGGTHSRDYNRLFNVGDINTLVLRAGWVTGKSAKHAEDSLAPYEYFAFAQPSDAATRWLHAPLPRFVTSRWGERPDQRLSHYLGKNLSIASAEANYHNMDTGPLAVNLGSGQDVPIITYVMEGRRDYYGTSRIIEPGSGHPKSLHLRPFVSSVQRGRDVLFIASGKNDDIGNVALESSFTLPADAEYWLNDHKLDLFTHTSAWQFEPAPDDKLTRIAVHKEGAREQVTLIDQDAKQGVGISRIFPATPGTRYRFNARLKGGSAALYINFLDATKRVIGSERIQQLPASIEFRDQQFEQTAPAGTVAVRAWLYSTISNQTQIELADLSFETIDEPSKTSRVLGSFDFEHFVPQAITVHAGDTLFVQRQDAALALRPLGAWDINNKPVDLQLFNDGLQWRALRLTATHGATRSDGRGVFAAWASAEEGLKDEAAFTAFRQRITSTQSTQRFDGSQLDVSVKPNEITLRVQADIAKGALILRDGANKASENTRSLDGKELGFLAQILRP